MKVNENIYYKNQSAADETKKYFVFKTAPQPIAATL